MGSVTLTDVAADAGVSVSTASKALSGTGRVAAATRARVSESANRLGFRPNALAQSFARGQSRTIGVMTQQIANTFTKAIVLSAATSLGERERATLIYDARVSDDEKMAESLEQFRARRIDGLLVVAEAPSHIWRSLSPLANAPVVYANMFTDDPQDVVITSDNVAVGRMAAEYLLSRGHRRIAHITAVEQHLDVQGRAAGAGEVLGQRGLGVVGGVRYGDWTPQWGEDAMAQLLREGLELDAVFCGNDHIAGGAERALQAAGLRVPEDVALIGVDNWEQRAIHMPEIPQHLTTVDVGLQEIGRVAATHLVDGSLPPGVTRVPPSLVLGITA